MKTSSSNQSSIDITESESIKEGKIPTCWGYHNILDQIRPKLGLICSTI